MQVTPKRIETNRAIVAAHWPMLSLFSLQLHVMDSGLASEELLRECWAFRLSIISLRPEVSRETDWNAFRAYFRPGVELMTMRARNGSLRGIFAWSLRTMDDDGHKRVVIDADYGFVHRAARGSIVVPFALLHVWLTSVRATRSLAIHLLGSGYPSGVLGFGRFVDRLVCLTDANIAPWERKLIQEYCAENDCEDASRGVLRMRTIPLESRRIPRTEKSRKLLAWYEAQVPHWEEGFGLAYIVRFDPIALTQSWLRATLNR